MRDDKHRQANLGTRDMRGGRFIAALAGGLPPPARASDIDIFGGAAGTALPNVLIIVDNTSSNDAAYASTCPFTGAPANLPNSNLLDMVYCALYGAVDAIKTNPQLLSKLNIALMSGGSGSNKGGQFYLPNSSPYNPVPMDLGGIAQFENAIIAGIPKATGNAKLDGDMTEAWAWFTGNTGPRSGTSYSAHIGTLSCQKSFIILIGATSKQGRPCNGSGCWSSSDLTTASWTTAQKVFINTTSVGPYTSLDSGSFVDEWARYFYQTDFNSNANDPQNVVFYTITAGSDPDNIAASGTPDYTQELKSAANQGGGKAFSGIDYNSIKNGLLQIFNEVAAVNSVFASPSLPTSSLSQGSFANQIYIGMFRPDQNDNPRWMGNLKQYKFGASGTASNPTLFLADSTGAAALSSATGFLSPGAVSFWTSKDVTKLPDNISPTGGFWVNIQQGQGQGFDSPDGEVVEKGGVSQQIRLANLQDNYSTNPGSPRKVYTCVNSSGNCATTNALSSFPFATTNTGLTQASFGITGPTSSVSSISRTGNVVTMVLTAAPTPALTNGQSVTVSGSANIELNGTFTITLVNSTTFTYTIIESPPTPSTGTYTASIPSSPVSLTSLTRTNGTTAQFTAAAANVFANGQKVTILGATQTEYNGSVILTKVNSTTYTYTITPGPGTAVGGGNATSGAGQTNPVTITSIALGSIGASSPFSATVTATINGALPAAYTVGSNVNVTNVVPGGYNGTYTITAFTTGKGNNKPAGTFSYVINTTPTSPATGTVSADPSISVSIAAGGLTHTASCTAPSSTTSVTVTATTATTNPFTAGQVVTISGTPGQRESAYLGSFTVLSPVTSTSFALSPMLVTSPPCSPSASGVSVSTGTATIDLTSFINWVRGDDDVGDEQSPDPGTITIRGSVHGDVLHSGPAVVNYGTGATPNVVVFYGSNDGMFRAVNGNQSGSITGSAGSFSPGQEMWSFVAPEFFTKLPRLYQDSPQVLLATTPTGLTPTPTAKDYYFDGGIGVYQNSDQSKTYIYLSARRGGRFVYALDVIDPTAPKFLWKKSNSDFTELGYTWSTPKAAFVRGYANPVIIMGGGYDPNEDSEPPGTDTMGRGIFILDALDGHLVWSATVGNGATGTCTGTCTLTDMAYAIPADITLLNRDSDVNGYIDRIYAADVGGNIWRVDLEVAGYSATGAAGPGANQIGPSTWQITKFASLGGTGTTKRKFFFPPDVGILNSAFDMVLAGTGDREHPLFGNSTQSYGIINRFYGLKDMNIGANVPAGWSVSGSTPGSNAPIVDSTSSTADNAVTGLTTVTASATYTPGTANNGFYYTFPNAGEKAVNAPASIGLSTFIGTSTPPTSSTLACNNLGTARGYQINYLTGAGASAPALFTGGGLPPSPIAGLVNVTIGGVNRLVPFVLGGGYNPDNPNNSGAGLGAGADDTSSLGGHAAKGIKPVRSRVYWYIDKHDN